MSSSRTYAAGAVLTAAQMNDLPQGTIGYAQAVAAQGSITAEVDLTSLTVAVTLVTGRRIRITGSVRSQCTATLNSQTLYIKEGATYLQSCTVHSAVANEADSIERAVVIQPSAGSHTYKLSLERSSGAGTVTMAASATTPAFILVEDIGV